MIIAVQSQIETRRGGPVPGLDRPCSQNPIAALPLVGSDPHVPCTPSGERGATDWGASVRWKNGVAELVQVDHGTAAHPVHAMVTCFEQLGHGIVENARSPRTQ